jgi:acyl-CoA thioesterase-1
MALDRIWKSVTAFATLAAIMTGTAIPSSAFAASAGKEIVIVAFGDSLTAGYQLPPSAAFPVQLEAALRGKGYNARVVNSGVSGDTAEDGLARFDWAMPNDADAVILELGANDALRGLPVAETKKSLDAILSRFKAKDIDVLMAGMEAPRNWGAEYVDQFKAMYQSLAKKYDTLFYPFFLNGVALDPSLSLSDGLHPNRQGVARIVEGILPQVEKLIDRVRKRRGES